MGPLSDLTASGAAVLKTLAKGMLGVLTLPGKVLGMALRGMLAAARWVWDGLKNLGAGLLSALTWPFRKGVEAAARVWRGVTGAVASAWKGIESLGAATFDAVAAPFRRVAEMAAGAWEWIRTSAAELWSGLGSLAQSAWSAVSAPFSWVADAATAAWSRITGAASAAWEGLKSMAGAAWEWIKAPFEGLASVASSAWETVKTAAASAWESVTTAVADLAGSAFESGKAILTTVPFSDAKEGPLADLTRSGMALLETLGGGIARAAEAPAKALERVFGFVGGLGRRVAAPAMLAGTLALTPVLAAEVPRVGGPMPVVRETTALAPSPEAPPERPLLPGETRGAPVPGPMIPGGPGVRAAHRHRGHHAARRPPDRAVRLPRPARAQDQELRDALR